MKARAVTLVQQKLYDGIADTLDFQEAKYDQGVWGTNVDYWLDDDGDKWEGRKSQKLELVANHKSCNTSACVAGWACLLSGYHPTIMINEIDRDEFNSYEWLPETINRYMTYNYDVMCNKENIATPKIYGIRGTSYRYMSMEDIDEDTGRVSIQDLNNLYDHVEIQNLSQYSRKIEFVRPDSLASVLLNLDDYEKSTLFSGEVVWTGDDIRSVGKGEDIEDLAYGCADSRGEREDEYEREDE